MSDIWSFLLQTLTASGAAAVLLAVKAMLRDKLSPRWQFAAWGMLALVLAVPAGLGGRYALLNWPLAVEFLRSLLTEEFGTLAHVSAPVPLPHFTGPPRTGAEHRPAHTGVPMITRSYTPRGNAVLRGFTGGRRRDMACIPLRIQPVRPERSTPSSSLTSSHFSSAAISRMSFSVFPVRL